MELGVAVVTKIPYFAIGAAIAPLVSQSIAYARMNLRSPPTSDRMKSFNTKDNNSTKIK